MKQMAWFCYTGILCCLFLNGMPSTGWSQNVYVIGNIRNQDCVEIATIVSLAAKRFQWKKTFVHVKWEKPIVWEGDEGSFFQNLNERLIAHLRDPEEKCSFEFIQDKQQEVRVPNSELITYQTNCAKDSDTLFHDFGRFKLFLNTQTRGKRNLDILIALNQSIYPPKIEIESPQAKEPVVRKCMREGNFFYEFGFSIHGDLNLENFFLEILDSTQTMVKKEGHEIQAVPLSKFAHVTGLSVDGSYELCVDLPSNYLFSYPTMPANYLDAANNVLGYFDYYLKLAYHGECPVSFPQDLLKIHFTAFNPCRIPATCACDVH